MATPFTFFYNLALYSTISVIQFYLCSRFGSRDRSYSRYLNDVDKKAPRLCTPLSHCEHRLGLINEIPELDGLIVVACYHGWLVFNGNYEWNWNTWCLYDPISRQRVELPRLENVPDGYFRCTMTSPPNGEAECLFVMFFTDTAFWCKPGDEHWNTQEVDFRPSSLAVRDGVIYGIVDGRDGLDELMVIEVDTMSNSIKTNQWNKKLERPSYPGSMVLSRYLVDSCSEFYMVVIDNGPEGIEYPRFEAVTVLKLDVELAAWVQAKSLNDCAFFIGYNCSASCRSPELQGAEKNCLYLRRNEAPTVYCYRIEDRSLTALLPCEKELPISSYFCCYATFPSYPSWTLADHRSPNQLVQVQKVENQNGTLNNQDLVDKKVLPTCGTLGTEFDRIPMEVIELLARKLNTMDYLSFRTACKLFHGAATLPIRPLSPWLMFFDNSESKFNLIDPANNCLQFMNVLPHLEGGRIVYSSRDGIIMCNDGVFYVCDPFAMVSIELPKHGDNTLDGIAFFPFPALQVVGISDVNDRIGMFRFSSADQQWNTYLFDYNLVDYFYLGYNAPVYHDEHFCFLDQVGELWEFRLTVDEAPTYQVWARPEGLLEDVYNSHLVECDGELLAVFLGPLGKWVQIFRLIDSHWVQVDRLDNQMLFLSRNSTLCAAAPSPEMGNRIYFPRFYGESVLYYSLRTKKYHALGNDSPINDFHCTREMLGAAWVLPNT